jgi:hypothetical protein
MCRKTIYTPEERLERKRASDRKYYERNREKQLLKSNTWIAENKERYMERVKFHSDKRKEERALAKQKRLEQI